MLNEECQVLDQQICILSEEMTRMINELNGNEITKRRTIEDSLESLL